MIICPCLFPDIAVFSGRLLPLRTFHSLNTPITRRIYVVSERPRIRISRNGGRFESLYCLLFYQEYHLPANSCQIGIAIFLFLYDALTLPP